MKTIPEQHLILEEKLHRASQELNTLYEISCAMRTTLELDHILYIILTSVTAHTGLGFNRALLFLVNKKDRCLECRMAIGPESGEHADRIWKYLENSKQKLEDMIQTDNIEEIVGRSGLYQSLKEFRLPLNSNDGSLMSRAYHQGVPIHIAPAQIGQFAHDPLIRVFPTNEVILIPLKAKDAVNGLIIADNLYTQKPIKEEDIKMFTMLANQAGLAIENSQLYEMVVQKSHTDSITLLWNHGFFQERLAEEVKDAQEKKLPLSLLIIDIDNFKQLNDTYGHQNGDMVLKEMAQILRNSSRTIDYVCRYGGEEFSVILVQTTKEQGFEVAERVRKNIESYRFAHFLPNADMNVTVSIGLATFPEHAATKEDLIANADKAMYIAKFGGKNRTCLP
ncbi:MAG: sensor domain-containing diguanylate cyclase [Candidatus Omnitrophota bacterium]|nr:sensor domain-containing diguanylate cyclase [Candidatus Omnitrophota bacterium]MDZ4242544.1 sensor domain-containing diguanylate cyclase [Candidatus Omnitrophota bacterium]